MREGEAVLIALSLLKNAILHSMEIDRETVCIEEPEHSKVSLKNWIIANER